MQTCDVDTPPNLPRLSIAVTVQTDTVAAADDEDVRVINDVGTTVPVSSERLDSDHVPGVYPGASWTPAVRGALCTTVVWKMWVWIDGR